MKKIIIFIVLLNLIFIFGSTVFAQEAIADPKPTAKVTSLTNPIPGDPSIQVLIGKIIQAVLGIVGSLALIMFIYGGFTWMLAAGNQQAVQKGKDIIIWATVGLVVIFASYALVKFVLTAVAA